MAPGMSQPVSDGPLCNTSRLVVMGLAVTTAPAGLAMGAVLAGLGLSAAQACRVFGWRLSTPASTPAEPTPAEQPASSCKSGPPLASDSAPASPCSRASCASPCSSDSRVSSSQSSCSALQLAVDEQAVSSPCMDPSASFELEPLVAPDAVAEHVVATFRGARCESLPRLAEGVQAQASMCRMRDPMTRKRLYVFAKSYPRNCTSAALEAAGLLAMHAQMPGSVPRPYGLVPQPSDPASTEGPALLMECAPLGDMSQLLKRLTKKHCMGRTAPLLMPEGHLRYYAARVLTLLAACHAAGYAHRDLKPANLLLGDAAQPLLADLGVACRLDGTNPGGRLYGTAGFTCPEGSLLMHSGGQALGSASRSLAVTRPELLDIWSFGALLLTLAVGGPMPLAEGGFEVALEAHTRQAMQSRLPGATCAHPGPAPVAQLWPQLPEGLAAMLRECVLVPLEQRWDAQQLLGHPWLEGVDASGPGPHLDLLTKKKRS